MSVIVHLVPVNEWPGVDAADEYRPATLDSGGFVHCAAPERAAAVAETLYAGRDDLLAVCLDTDRLDAPVQYESASGGDGGADGDDFPHVYGPLNSEAVVAVIPLPRDDGGFSPPEELRELG